MEEKDDLEKARPTISEEKCVTFPVMSRESIDLFRSYLECQGKKNDTVQTYRRCVERLFAFLPDDKEIRPDTLLLWRDAMFSENFSVSSINVHIVAANAYLEFSGRGDLQLAERIPRVSEKKESPALTWPEYLRLLQTAQTLGNKRAEMLIKLFCETGIRLCEASNVTLEALSEGAIVTGSRSSPKRVLLPPDLRKELRDYADSVGVRSGPLFVRQSGEPLDHSEILPIIVKLFKKAGVPREKATTRTLRRFHRDWATRDRIHAEVAEQVRAIYESLLSRGRSFTT